jgi:succinate dehydrogenase (ubiquinone) cytochrome b560 subunit
MFNHITGVALSGGLYVFALSYLAAPVFGWQITSAAMAAGFAKWPLILKLASKTAVALPFTFHSLNGLRHLVWDLGLTITNKQVAQTGWTVVGLSVASALGLAFFV